MIDLPDEIEGWSIKLSAFLRSHRLAFAACVCERLIPCYKACSVLERKGDHRLLERCMAGAWECVALGRPPDGRDVSERVGPLLEQLDKFAGLRAPLDWRPDAPIHLFDSFLGFQAECSLYAVEALLRGCLEGKEAEYAAAIVDASLTGVLAFVGSVNDPPPVLRGDVDCFADPTEEDMYEEFLDSLPLMLHERECLDADYRRLSIHRTLTPELLTELRRTAGCAGLQPFRRGLVWLPKERWDEIKAESV